MVHICAVYGCNEKAKHGTNYKFYPFPQPRKNGINMVMSEIKLRRRNAWYQALKRSDFTESEVTFRRICSKHFISGAPADDKDETNPDWVPSLHLGHRDSNSPGTAELKYVKWKRWQERKNKCSTSSIKRKGDYEQSFSNALKMAPDTTETILADEAQSIVESEPINNQEIDRIRLQSFSQSDVRKMTEDNAETISEDVTQNITDSEPSYIQSIEQVLQVVDSVPSEKTDDADNSFFANLSASTSTDNLITSKSKTSEAQTDFTWRGIDLSAILSDLQKRTEENGQLKKKLFEKDKIISKLTLDESAFVNNDKMVRFFTGLPNLQALKLILDEVEPALTKIKVKKMNNFQKLMMTLMKLRMNASNVSLSYRFNLSLKQVNHIFTKVIVALDCTFKNFIHWPDCEGMRLLMPQSFEERFGNKVAVIIDCFEITIQRPSTLRARNQTFSNYKQRQTVKYLIGITPHGVISFISRGYGGRTTDDYIAEHCGIVDHLLPGDVMLADRGFTIKEIIGVHQAELKTPAFKGRKAQVSARNVEETREIAAVRVHVERVIGCVRQKYRFLNGPIPISMLSKKLENETLLDSVLRVCCSLFNLCEPIVSL